MGDELVVGAARRLAHIVGVLGGGGGRTTVFGVNGRVIKCEQKPCEW